MVLSYVPFMHILGLLDLQLYVTLVVNLYVQSLYLQKSRVGREEKLLRLCDSPTLGAFPQLRISLPILDDRLELSAKIGDMKALLADNRRRHVRRRPAVPAQTVCEAAAHGRVFPQWDERRGLTGRVRGPHALDDEPDGVREAHGVVRGVRCPTRRSARRVV